MTKITVVQSDGYMKIEVKGHANYAPHGKDIVCAGISAIVQTCALGLQAIADMYSTHVKFEVKKK